MALLELVARQQALRRRPAAPRSTDLSFTLEARPDPRPPRPLGLRQDHDAAADRGLRDRPTPGEIAIAGRAVADRAGEAGVPPEARGVGVVFQDYALFPHLTVGDNVAFGLARLAARRAPRRGSREVLDLVGLADSRRALSPRAVRRPAAARGRRPAPWPPPRRCCCSTSPSRTSTPTCAPRCATRSRRSCAPTGTTAIFVTHDQEEAFTIADEVGVLNHGRLEQLGSPETIYHHPATPFVAEFVGAADFLPGLVTAEGIVTELGVFENVEGREPGEKVRVMIRPDDVTLRARAAGRRRDRAALLPGLREPLLPRPALRPSGALLAALVRGRSRRAPRAPRGQRPPRRDVPRRGR